MKKVLFLLLLCLAPALADNAELTKLCEADQAARQGVTILGPEVAAQDKVRREAVLKMLANNQITTENDYFNAALIMQHGDKPEDYMLAHELAMVAAFKGHENGKWLAAASWDRLLQNMNRSQRFGTQYRKPTGQGWTLEPLDTSLPDSVRKECNVPTLEEARQKAVQLNSPAAPVPPK